MSKRNKIHEILENVTVVDIATDGRAVAKVHDLVVFISHAIPGDIVDVRVIKKRKKYVETVPVRFVKYSPYRVEAFCKNFEGCGGCKWQDFDYAHQLVFKHKHITDCFARIGKLPIPEIPPVIRAEQTIYYRNKLEFTFSSNRWLSAEELKDAADGKEIDNNALGFHVQGRFDKAIDIDVCYLQADPSNSIRNGVREFALNENMPFYNLRSHQGFLRTMIIRTSSNGELMVIVTFKFDDVEKREKLLNFIWKRFPEVSSLMYVINPKLNDSIADLEVNTFRGKAFLTEEMEGLKFKIGAKSFYQTNSKQAYELYRIIRDFAGLTGNEIVYDLYTGIGTIANFVAKNAKKVIGVEFVEEAIEDANHNSAINNVFNTFFFAGDMKDVFTIEFIQRHGTPDVVIIDPPRAGVHPKVIEALMFAAPSKVIYVSCNPSSQARDIALMTDNYRITAIQPVDMFPHTHHIENVVKLERIN